MIEGQIIRKGTRVTAPSADDATDAVEGDAGRMLSALELIAATKSSDAREAQRHVERMRFAMARARELRATAGDTRGVFAPARLEVGLSILEGCTGMAASFVNRAMAVKRPPRPVRDVHAAVDVAVNAVSEQQAKAA